MKYYALATLLACAACGGPSSGDGKSTTDATTSAVTTGGGTNAGGGAATGGTGAGSTGGSSTGGTTGPYTGTDISGVVLLTPQIYGSNPAQDMENITVYAQAAATGKPLTNMAGTVVTTTLSAKADPTCKPSACPFKLPGVDLSGEKSGLQLVMKDSRTTGATWVLTTSATAPADAVTKAINERSPMIGQYIWALDANGVAALATATGKPAATLNKGAIIGLMLQNAQPVGGVTVAPPSNASVYYPSVDYSSNLTSTDPMTGLWVGLPVDATKTVLGTFTIKPPDTNSAFASYSLYVYPNEYFIVAYLSTK